MALIEINWRPSNRDLRLFAVLQALLLGGVALFVLPPAGVAAQGLLAVSSALGVIGLAAPQAIRWFYVGWMILAFPVGWFVTHVLLAAVFYLLIAPIGLLMRLLGHDPLERKLDRSARSYWIPRKAEMDKRRWFQQY